MSGREYQSRYVAYAAAHGRSPGDMLVFDRERWPGGAMAGFILWITARWREWDANTGHRGSHGPAEHKAFDAWLAMECEGVQESLFGGAA